ncbi:MAG: phosphoribulokinase, partial [Gammaproteobacteria bacterium]|nr:phosphoribulokinase [Gammaproteobacteria bacterium]
VVDSILRRMPDYVKHITPQFSETDINFQRVATVDTSNPFIARDIPTLDESFVVIRFRKPDIRSTDFTNLLSMISGSFMSRRNTIVVPGGKMGMAMEIIMTPIISELIKQRREV